MAQNVLNHSANFLAGIGGRVVIGSAIAAFIKEWSIEISTEIYGAPTFESPVAHNLAWDVKRFVGLSEAKVELTGYASLDSADLVLKPGVLVSLTLFLSVDSGLAVIVPRAVVQSVSYSQDATGTSPVEFKASLEVDGPVGMMEG